MPINFPTGPSLNDLYTFNGRTWKWNGEGWQAEPASYGPQGPQGATGPQGPQGPSVTDASLLTSGTLASARLPSGTILQVVQATTSTVTSNATNTYADTGLTATITPRATSSKVFVITDHMVWIGGSADYFGIKVLRGATDIHLPVSDATGPYEFGHTSAVSQYTRIAITLLDSPNTTSATTYKTQFRRYSTDTVGINGDGGQTTSGTSRIILMEVAG